MKSLIATYFVLIFLLGLTVAISQSIAGPASFALAMLISVLKTLSIVWVFMELRASSSLIKFTAVAALVWLMFFYVLIATDLLTRPIMTAS